MTRSTLSGKLFFCVLILPLLFSLTNCSPGGDKGGAEGDAAAVVNGVPIPMEELDQAVERVTNQYKQFGMPFDSTKVDSLKEQLLDTMVKTELLYQESKEAGFVLTEEELEDEIQTIKDQYPDEETFQKILEGQGLTNETFIDQMARNLTIRDYIEDRAAKREGPTEEEKEQYYEEHKEEYKHAEEVAARHILLQTDKEAPPDSLEKKKEKMESLLQRVKEGEDFAELAKEHSDCPSAPKGGDLGFFSRGMMVKPFEEAAFSLEVGEVSDVVKTSYGYHIIKIYDKREAGYSTYEEVADDIAETINRSRTNEEVEALLDELYQEADIEILI